jgi:hypothetical protein
VGLCSGGAVVRRWLGLRLRDGRRKRGSGSFCRAAGCLGVRVWRGGSPWISAGDRGGALCVRGRCGRREKKLAGGAHGSAAGRTASGLSGRRGRRAGALTCGPRRLARARRGAGSGPLRERVLGCARRCGSGCGEVDRAEGEAGPVQGKGEGRGGRARLGRGKGNGPRVKDGLGCFGFGSSFHFYFYSISKQSKTI